MKRRTFMGVGAAAGAALATTAASYARVVGANDRINIGVIGCGGRSGGLMNDMAAYLEKDNFTFSALCDVWKPNLEKRAAWVREKTGSSPYTCSRYMDLLERKDVDGVMITTSDHAHSPILIAACDMGKDAFCEKPMSKNIREANQAVEAVRRNGRVVQIGTQRRSDGSFMAGAEYMRSGKLGITSVIDLKWNDNGPRWNRSYADVKQEDVDWEAYLMYLPMRPFDPRRYRCWHLYRDYSIGTIGLLGAHLTDLVTWYMDAPYPESAVGFGDRLVWKQREHYDTLVATYRYPQGFIVTCEHRFGNNSMRAESVFYGTNGIFLNNTVSTEGRTDPKRAEPQGTIYKTSPLAAQETDGKPAEMKLDPNPRGMDHNINWIHAMRDRRDPNAPVEAGFSHSLVAIMGHLAADTGKRIVYDPFKREVREA